MQEEKPILQISKIIRYVLAAISVATLIFLLWYIRSVTIYILLGVVFSLIGRPIFNFLGRFRFRKRYLPDTAKAILSLVAVWLVFVGLFAILLPSIANEANKLSEIDPDKFMSGLQEPLDKAVYFMEDYGLIDYLVEDSSGVPEPVTEMPQKAEIDAPILDTIQVDDSTYLLVHKKIIRHGEADSLPAEDPGGPVMAEVDSGKVQQHQDSLLHEYNKLRLQKMLEKRLVSIFDITQVTGMFSSIFGLITQVFIGVFAVTFIAFFFLKDKNLFANMVLALTPERYERQAMVIMNESRKMLSRYFIGLVLELILVMFMTSVGLMIIGFEIRTAITIGFFCGFFNVIPYLGPILGGAFGILLGITTHLDLDVQTELLPLILKMLAVFSISQFIDNWILQPMIFSNSVNAHPLEIFIVLLIFGAIGGIPGMVFAVPGYSFLRIIARQFFNNFKLVRSLTRNM